MGCSSGKREFDSKNQGRNSDTNIHSLEKERERERGVKISQIRKKNKIKKVGKILSLKKAGEAREVMTKILFTKKGINLQYIKTTVVKI